MSNNITVPLTVPQLYQNHTIPECKPPGYNTPYRGVYNPTDGTVNGTVQSGVRYSLAPHSFAGISPDEQKQFAIERLIAIVAETFNCQSSDLFLKTKNRKITECRFVAIYFLWLIFKMPHKDAAGYFGLERTASNHGKKDIGNKMKVYPDFKVKINNIHNTLRPCSKL